ncbi:uncharacterized protein LOC117188911 [Drosophila miranda]|uniref:uncharacterized protein LOC117188911 n=1 Tax=Drosophila miranda TaxID=7229 RepID=UPI00143F4B79|nr:uncharacterized protein LOC117188911 [Drosophila miranda]
MDNPRTSDAQPLEAEDGTEGHPRGASPPSSRQPRSNYKQDTTPRPRKQNRATPRSMDHQQENPNGPIPDTSWDDGWHARLQEWDAQEEAAAPERGENPDWQPLDHAPMKWLSPVPTNHNAPNPEPTSCTAREAEPGNPSQPKEDSDLSLGLEEAEAGGLLTAFEEMPELNALQEEQEWPIAPVAWRVSTPDRRIPQSLRENASAQANAARHGRSRIRIMIFFVAFISPLQARDFK